MIFNFQMVFTSLLMKNGVSVHHFSDVAEQIRLELHMHFLVFAEARLNLRIGTVVEFYIECDEVSQVSTQIRFSFK